MHLCDPKFCATVIPELNASEQDRYRAKLITFTNKGSKEVLGLVKRIDLSPGNLMIELSAKAIAAALEIGSDPFIPKQLTFQTQFQLRKRGVETKIIIADTPTGSDKVLIQNIARANYWYGWLKKATPSPRLQSRKPRHLTVSRK